MSKRRRYHYHYHARFNLRQVFLTPGSTKYTKEQQGVIDR